MHQLSYLFFLLALSCGLPGQQDNKTSDEGGGSPSNPLTNDQAWLTKQWQGIHKSTSNGTAANDAADAKVEVTFQSNRKFSMQFPESEGAYVKGDYVVSGQKVILSVRESTVSSLGRPGTRKVLSYELRGKDLTLYDDKLKMALTEAVSSNPLPSQPEPSTPDLPKGDSTSLFGNWTCQLNTLIWRMTLVDDFSFSIKAFLENSGTPFETGGFLTSYIEKPAPKATLSFPYKESQMTMDLTLVHKGQKLQVALRESGRSTTRNRSFSCRRL